MFHFITHLFSRPFSHVERYDSIRVDTCVKQIISNVHVSMICEQWLTVSFTSCLKAKMK